MAYAIETRLNPRDRGRSRLGAAVRQFAYPLTE